jgi:hypothetical protein
MTAGLTRRQLAAALTVLAAPMAMAAGETGRWKRAESPNFVVYGDAQEKELRVYVDRLEQFDWTLRLMHGLDLTAPAGRKLDIYLVSDRKMMRRAWPGIDDLVGGYYSASPRDIYAVAERDSVLSMSRAGWEETILFHEYTHHFMLHYFPYAYPAWLIEGYAEYFGVTTIDGPRIEIGKFSSSRVSTLAPLKEWLPLEDVLGKPLGKIPNDKHLMFYAQAWLLTHYMISDPERNKQLRAYMAEVAKGGDPVTTFFSVTGVSAADLTHTLHDYSTGRIVGLRLTRKAVVADTQVAVSGLSRSADDLLMESLQLSRDLTIAEGAALLKAVREKAAPYPADRFAQFTLAHAECRFGDPKAGLAILDRYPDDAVALELEARVRVAQGVETSDAKAEHDLALAAQPFIGKAFKLDASRYQTLWTYVRSRQVLDKVYPSDNTLDVLLTALDLAPQVSEIRFEAAQALGMSRRYPEAIAVLGPLLNDPHGGGANSSAHQLLQRLQAQMKAAGG